MVEHQKSNRRKSLISNWHLRMGLPPRFAFCLTGYALAGLVSVSVFGESVAGSHAAVDQVVEVPAVVTSSGSATTSKSPEPKPIELTEDQYLWLQSIRQHAGVDARSLIELNLDQKDHEKLLRDFVQRALRAKLQLDALTQETVAAKQKQRKALQAMATGDEAVNEREYRELVSIKQQCERDCQKAMALLGQQSRRLVGIEAPVKGLQNPQANLSVLRQRFLKSQTVAQLRDETRRKGLQLAKIKNAEASVLAIPGQLAQAGLDLNQLDVEASRENLSQ